MEKPLEQRTDEDIFEKLIPMIKNVSFFKQEDELSNQDLKFIAEKLKFKFIPENNFVFRQGDHGDSFYIIIKGSVSVLIKAKNDEGSKEKKEQ